MGTKLSQPDEELYRRVDEVLFFIWDPIGVSHMPAARKEYYRYLPNVFNLLKNDASPEKIANYLTEISINRMGLSENRLNDDRAANLLLEWKKQILEV